MTDPEATQLVETNWFGEGDLAEFAIVFPGMAVRQDRGPLSPEEADVRQKEIARLKLLYSRQGAGS